MTQQVKEIREQILAKYFFSQKELAELGGECGRVTATINNLKEEAKSVAAEYKGRIDARETQRNVISTKLANGYEMRPVEAIVQYYPEHKTKVYLHPDTGAIIREEEMTHADWQLPMFSKEELAKTEKPKPEEKPREYSEEENAIIKAALEQTKVEADLDAAAENDGVTGVLNEFRIVAKDKAGWPKNLIAGIAKLAEANKEQGTGAVIEFLRPFIVTK